jgi:hypothetical protein
MAKIAADAGVEGTERAADLIERVAATGAPVARWGRLPFAGR